MLTTGVEGQRSVRFCGRLRSGMSAISIACSRSASRGRGAPGPVRATGGLTVDVDSFVGEVHGYAKHGAAFGYTRKRGYHPMLTSRAETGKVRHLRSRKGVGEHAAPDSALTTITDYPDTGEAQIAETPSPTPSSSSQRCPPPADRGADHTTPSRHPAEHAAINAAREHPDQAPERAHDLSPRSSLPPATPGPRRRAASAANSVAHQLHNHRRGDRGSALS